MPRPKRCRRVCCDPEHRYFKPQGIPLAKLEWIDLELDELEAFRLSDAEGLTQSDAARRMNISQPTFNRILNSARSKASRCIAEGLALRIASLEASDGTAVPPRRTNARWHTRREDASR